MTYEDYYFLTPDSRKFLSRGYLFNGQTAESRFEEIAHTAERILGIEGFADKVIGYIKKGYYCFSTPVLCNFGKETGLPISCNNSHVSDSIDSILYKMSEVGVMTKHGAGTSGYFGKLRPRGSLIKGGDNGVSFGPVHFIKGFEQITDMISQGSSRRGGFAAYLDINHPDINEFISMRDLQSNFHSINFGVCIDDAFMQAYVNGEREAKELMVEIVKKRFATGFPYIFFTDNVNKNKPQVYKDKKYEIRSSNMCSEICLPSNEDESFVCNLSHINLLHWEEIKKTDAVETLFFLLDAVLTEYVEKTEHINFMQHAHNFAKRHRAIGLGVCGYHSYLQSKGIPFEGMVAHRHNIDIFKTLDKMTMDASKKLAEMYGEPEVLKGYGMRNTTRIAIAPTTSSSNILGHVSPGIEPMMANVFMEDTAKGGYVYKNPFLKEILEKYGKDNRETWASMNDRAGSCQHLDFLTDEERKTFKTFDEISQKEIIIQQSQRQKYMDQSASLNLKIPALQADSTYEDALELFRATIELIVMAWELGVKTLYYHRSTNPSSEHSRKINLECISCQ